MELGLSEKDSIIVVDEVKKIIPFIFSEHELVMDELTALKNVTSR